MTTHQESVANSVHLHEEPVPNQSNHQQQQVLVQSPTTQQRTPSEDSPSLDPSSHEHFQEDQGSPQTLQGASSIRAQATDSQRSSQTSQEELFVHDNSEPYHNPDNEAPPQSFSPRDSLQHHGMPSHQNLITPHIVFRGLPFHPRRTLVAQFGPRFRSPFSGHPHRPHSHHHHPHQHPPPPHHPTPSPGPLHHHGNHGHRHHYHGHHHE